MKLGTEVWRTRIPNDATVQNRMHVAVHGHTAVELIYSRADAQKDHMGLTTWEDGPKGKIKKSDVTIAKNYLSEDELEILGRIVNAFLEFAEVMTKVAESAHSGCPLRPCREVLSGQTFV